MLDFSCSRCCTKRKASKSNLAAMERPLFVTCDLWSTEQLVEDRVIKFICQNSRPKAVFVLKVCTSVPDEEVVLLVLRQVVSTGSTEAVIQQDMETENRTVFLQWCTFCHKNTLCSLWHQYLFSDKLVYQQHPLIQVDFTYFPVRLTALTST